MSDALDAAFTAQETARDAAFVASEKAVSVAMSAAREALGAVLSDWCVGCRDIAPSHSMRWTDDGRYLCSACTNDQPSYRLPVLRSVCVVGCDSWSN